MTYELEFHEKALKEFQSLSQPIKDRFKAKLRERLEDPHVPSAQLRGRPNRYKIKLKRPGFRLVYEVHDNRLVVQVIAVGRRERSEAYERANKR